MQTRLGFVAPFRETRCCGQECPRAALNRHHSIGVLAANREWVLGGSDCSLTSYARRGFCAKMAHRSEPPMTPHPHRIATVSPPYRHRAPIVAKKWPEVCHFGTVWGVQGTRKPIGVAGFRGKRFRLTVTERTSSRVAMVGLFRAGDCRRRQFDDGLQPGLRAKAHRRCQLLHHRLAPAHVVKARFVGLAVRDKLNG